MVHRWLGALENGDNLYLRDKALYEIAFIGDMFGF